MSAADQMRLAYAKESTYKTVPSGTYKVIPFVNESLAQQTQTTRSNTITTDGQVNTVKRTGITAGGATNIELIGGGYDDLLLSSIRASAFTTVGTATTGVAVTGTNTFSGLPGGLIAGDVICTYGFTNRENNGVHLMASSTTVAGSYLTVETASSAKGAKKGGQALNGITADSYTLEKGFMDLTNEFSVLPGSIVSGASVSVSMQAMITGAFQWNAAKEVSTSAAAGSTYTPASTNEAMASVDEFSGPWAINETPATVTRQVARAVSATWSWNLRPNMNLATIEAAAMKYGQFNCTGTWQSYFATKTLMDRYLTYQPGPFMFGASDATGSGYAFYFPYVKFTQGPRVAGGINTDIIADLAWEAQRDPTLGYTLKVYKF